MEKKQKREQEQLDVLKESMNKFPQNMLKLEVILQNNKSNLRQNMQTFVNVK